MQVQWIKTEHLTCINDGTHKQKQFEIFENTTLGKIHLKSECFVSEALKNNHDLCAWNNYNIKLNTNFSLTILKGRTVLIANKLIPLLSPKTSNSIMAAVCFSSSIHTHTKLVFFLKKNRAVQSKNKTTTAHSETTIEKHPNDTYLNCTKDQTLYPYFQRFHSQSISSHSKLLF